MADFYAFTDDPVDRPGKRRKNMLEEGLEFDIEEDAEKMPSTMVATEKRSAAYHKTIEMPVVVQLGGQAFIFEAGQNLGTQSQTYWNKVKEMLKVIDRHTPEVDKVPNMLDATGREVSAALLPCLLGQDGRMRYTDDGGKVNQKLYKPFLERIARNVNCMLANPKQFKAQITNDRPMTRDRLARESMNQDLESTTITMREHYDMMNSQHTSLLSIVEVVRRQLVNHGIAISNLAQNINHDLWELHSIAKELVKTIEAKEKSDNQNSEVQKYDKPQAYGAKSDNSKADGAKSDNSKADGAKPDNSREEGVGGSSAFFDPATQSFRRELNPLMLKLVHGHQCLCMNCASGYSDVLEAKAEETVDKRYEASINSSVRMDLYNTALHRHREKSDAAAYQKFREEVKVEVEAEYVREKKAKYEQEWAEAREAEVRKMAVEEYKKRIADLAF